MMRVAILCGVLCACDVGELLPDAGVAVVEQHVDSVVVDPATGVPGPGAQWVISAGHVMLIGSWDVPISLTPGTVVPTISSVLRGNASTCAGCLDGNSVLMQLVSLEGSATSVIGQAFSNDSGIEQTVQFNVTHTVVATELLRVRFLTWMELGQTPTRSSEIGIIRIGAQPTIQAVFPAGMAVPLPGSPPPSFGASGLEAWTLNPNGQISLPIALSVGSRFATWTVYLRKLSPIGTAVTASLRRFDMATSSMSQVSSARNSSNSPGPIQLTGLGGYVDETGTYQLLVTGGAGSAADVLFGWSVSQ